MLSWKGLCIAIQIGATVGNNSDMLIESVGLWHQLLRQPALDLSRGIGESVEISFTTENIRNPELLLAEEAA